MPTSAAETAAPRSPTSLPRNSSREGAAIVFSFGLAPSPEPRVETRDHDQTHGAEHYAQRAADARPPRDVLLDRHHDAEDEHPGEAPRAEREHQEHQRPAAPDAEGAVPEPETQRLARMGRARPVLHHEHEGRAAPIEAPVLERRELIRAGHEQRACAERPQV